MIDTPTCALNKKWKTKFINKKIGLCFMHNPTWWERMDLNHRRHSRRIYSPFHLAALELSQKNGAGGRNRTNNRLITNQMLYHWATPAWIFGALGRNRTTDTGIFSPLLYRLSYQGKILVKTFGKLYL